MKSNQGQKKTQNVKNSGKDNQISEADASAASTKNSKKRSIGFSKREAILIGGGIILGLILGVLLFQRGATLCEVNIGPLKFALPCSSASTPPPLSCTDYGIQFQSHQTGAKVWGTFNVSGTYVNKPMNDSILLTLKTPYGDYFPQGKVTMDTGARIWQGEVNLEDNNPKEGYTIIVSVMKNNGRALLNYFTKVLNETGRSVAIVELTDDIVECDRVPILHEQE